MIILILLFKLRTTLKISIKNYLSVTNAFQGLPSILVAIKIDVVHMEPTQKESKWWGNGQLCDFMDGKAEIE